MEFILKTKNTYDLIIVDVFEDTTMPDFLFQNFFIKRNCFLLNKEGCNLFNTMILTDKENTRNENLIAECKSNELKIRTLRTVKSHNELIIIEKK